MHAGAPRGLYLHNFNSAPGLGNGEEGAGTEGSLPGEKWSEE